LQWSKLRFGEDAQVNFSVIVDPLKALSPGMYYRHLSIPVDIVFKREDKLSPGTFEDWYSNMKTLAFEIYIPGE